MSATQKAPNYQVVTIPLALTGELPVGNAQGAGGADLGQLTVTGEADYLSVISAVDATGNVNPNAVVNVRVGRGNQAFVPLRINSEMTGEATEWQFQWTVSAGTVLVLLSFSGNQPAGLKLSSPPIAQLISGSLGTTFVSSDVAVGLAAVQVSAADATRQSLVVEAVQANTANVYVNGSNAVTTGNGIELQPGQSIVIDNTTSAIWAIAAAAGQHVRVAVQR